MKLKGLEKFREKIPAFSGKRVIFLPIYIITLFILLNFLIHSLYQMPSTISTSWSSFLPLLGIIIIDGLGVILVYQMWLWRDKLKAKYHQTSYQHIFLVGFAGIGCIIFLAFNSFFPLGEIDPQLWSTSPYYIWVSSLTSFIPGDWVFLDMIRTILGICLLVIGVGTMIRSILTFGFDYMTVVYLYFPEESQIQNHAIYSVLRHPTYASLIYICIGGFFYNFSLFNLFYLIVYVIEWSIHILGIEEKELIQRFGDSYQDYRRTVPAIFVKPKKWGIYFRFLIGV